MGGQEDGNSFVFYQCALPHVESVTANAGDFGLFGERPTHPELLDFLAVVCSASSTTSQSSEATEVPPRIDSLAKNTQNSFDGYMSTSNCRRATDTWHASSQYAAYCQPFCFPYEPGPKFQSAPFGTMSFCMRLPLTVLVIQLHIVRIPRWLRAELPDCQSLWKATGILSNWIRKCIVQSRYWGLVNLVARRSAS